MDDKLAQDAADALAKAISADILFYNGEVSQNSCRKLIELGSNRKRAIEVLLVLVTPSGDPDARSR